MKRLVLDRSNRKVFGLCSGIANYFGVDPTLVRLIVLTATILTSFVPGTIFYLVAAGITPKGPKGTPHAQA